MPAYKSNSNEKARNIASLKDDIRKNAALSVDSFKEGNLGWGLRYFGSCLRVLGDARAKAENAQNNALMEELGKCEAKVLKNIFNAIRERDIHKERALGAEEEWIR